MLVLKRYGYAIKNTSFFTQLYNFQKQPDQSSSKWRLQVVLRFNFSRSLIKSHPVRTTILLHCSANLCIFFKNIYLLPSNTISRYHLWMISHNTHAISPYACTTCKPALLLYFPTANVVTTLALKRFIAPPTANPPKNRILSTYP